MVHALEGIRRLLRSDGTLIDIHPVPEAPLIRVELDGTIVLVESGPGYDYEEDLLHADDALADVVARGVYVADPSQDFVLITHASSVAELRDHLAETGAYDDGPEDEAVTARKEVVYARVDETMKASGERAVVSVHEKARMTRLTPMLWS